MLILSTVLKTAPDELSPEERLQTVFIVSELASADEDDAADRIVDVSTRTVSTIEDHLQRSDGGTQGVIVLRTLKEALSALPMSEDVADLTERISSLLSDEYSTIMNKAIQELQIMPDAADFAAVGAAKPDRKAMKGYRNMLETVLARTAVPESARDGMFFEMDVHGRAGLLAAYDRERERVHGILDRLDS
jgi:hypothetical protein